MTYAQSISFTQPFLLTEKENAPFKNLAVHVGDCGLNHKNLPEYLTYLRQNNIEGWYSIPADGFRLQKPEKWQPYLEKLREAGTEILEFTLYGKDSTHDSFAGFRGSYLAIFSLADLWIQLGGKTEWGLVLHKNNLTEVSDVRAEISARFGSACPASLWDYLGWGTASENLRIDREDLLRLDTSVHTELSPLKTEQEWIELLCEVKEAPFSANPQVMHLAIDSTGTVKLPYTKTINGHNGPVCGQLPFTTVQEIMEKQQQIYQSWQVSYPYVGELCQNFGDTENPRLYNLRSIIRKWAGFYETSKA